METTLRTSGALRPTTFGPGWPGEAAALGSEVPKDWGPRTHQLDPSGSIWGVMKKIMKVFQDNYMYYIYHVKVRMEHIKID